jgi:hypothetical protein
MLMTGEPSQGEITTERIDVMVEVVKWLKEPLA